MIPKACAPSITNVSRAQLSSQSISQAGAPELRATWVMRPLGFQRGRCSPHYFPDFPASASLCPPRPAPSTTYRTTALSGRQPLRQLLFCPRHRPKGCGRERPGVRSRIQTIVSSVLAMAHPVAWSGRSGRSRRPWPAVCRLRSFTPWLASCRSPPVQFDRPTAARRDGARRDSLSD